MGPGKWAQHHPNPKSLQNVHEMVGAKERELHTRSPMATTGRDLSVAYPQDHHLGMPAACFQASRFLSSAIKRQQPFSRSRWAFPPAVTILPRSLLGPLSEPHLAVLWRSWGSFLPSQQIGRVWSEVSGVCTPNPASTASPRMPCFRRGDTESIGSRALAAVPQTGGLCRCLLLRSIYQVKVIALETPGLLTVRDEGRLVRICTESLLVPGGDWGKTSAWTRSLQGAGFTQAWCLVAPAWGGRWTQHLGL